MFCKNCGTPLEDSAKACANCGTLIEEEQVKETPVPQQTVVYTAPAAPVVTKEISEENRPLSPWAYYGLQLLFSLPLVGFICLIVFSLDNGNINRRNFARSYWCNLIISLAVTIVVIVLLLVTGLGADIISEMEYMF